MRNREQEAEQYIKNLIRSGESQQLDFKFEISNAQKLARTLSAFANTNGGKLLIGVKDNGKIAGVRSEEEAYMAESAAHVFCKPEVRFTIKRWVVDGKSILEVDIPLSRHKPHFAKSDGKWVAYVRVNDQNIRANRILLHVWKNKEKRAGAWLKFGREEQALMDYLAENETVTLSRFIRVARTNFATAEKILVNLILMDVIRMELTEKTVCFRLNKEHNSLL
ncbi:MAG: ATP-binding protein [Bacteroidales bacterium]|nr:ATP-binding protein [Bacteroidales bacterium]